MVHLYITAAIRWPWELNAQQLCKQTTAWTRLLLPRCDSRSYWSPVCVVFMFLTSATALLSVYLHTPCSARYSVLWKHFRYRFLNADEGVFLSCCALSSQGHRTARWGFKPLEVSRIVHKHVNTFRDLVLVFLSELIQFSSHQLVLCCHRKAQYCGIMW